GLLAPEHHEGNDLDFGQRNRGLAGSLRTLDENLAQGGGKHTRGFKKSNEAYGLGAQGLVFVVSKNAFAVAQRGVGQWPAFFGGLGQAVKPAQRMVDVFVLETRCSELVRQYIGLGARLRRVVVFEQINQSVEHKCAIPVAVMYLKPV